MKILAEVVFDVAMLALLGLLVAGARHVHSGACHAEDGHGFPPGAEAATHR